MLHLPRSTALGSILAFSIVINTWGIDWGLPERWHPDELTQRAENMVGGPSLNPHYFAYGSFHYYLIAAFAVLPIKLPNKILHLMDYDTQSTVVVVLSRFFTCTVVPPARVPQTLEQRRRVPVDEVHIPADRLVEQFQNASPRMPLRHRIEHVGEVFDEVEDHGAALAVDESAAVSSGRA